jgi:hypothetical protein
MTETNDRAHVHPPLRRLTRVVLVLVGLALVLLVTSRFVVAPRLGDVVRERAIEILEEEFDGEAEIERMHVDVFPRLVVSGTGLTLSHRGREGVPPLLRIREFSTRAGYLGLLRTPRRIGAIRLDGLEINIPPREKEREPVESDEPPRIVVDQIVADDAMLRIIPREKDKEPKEFPIHRLRLRTVGLEEPWAFEAELTNHAPPGRIQTSGRFGPWQREDPSITPISGEYTFREADLGVFGGISGTLSSTGTFEGPLDRMAVRGEVDIPDFAVEVAGNPVHLKTRFDATVDGTDGDTYLNEVVSRVRRTTIVARGKVVGHKGRKGRTVQLDVAVDDGRIEDLMLFAVEGQRPIMTGAVGLKTSFLLPPGQRDIVDKLRLDGRFRVAKARFTDAQVQEKVNEMSRKAQGEPESDEQTLSDLQARFRLGDGVLAFPSLRFDVEGGSVRLEGTYALEGGALDFEGVLQMDARISQTTTGAKSFFLRLADPFFRKKGGGSEVPIKVGGTREEPDFGLDVKRALLPGQ